MSTKHQKIRIKLSSDYEDDEKLLIAGDIISTIVKRTLKRKDKNGAAFKGYSKSYANSKVGKAAGKRVGQPANLKLRDKMLKALGEYVKVTPQSVTIGYNKGSIQNGKADGNIRGTYGKSRANKSKARDFLGISDKELRKILKQYPHVEDDI